MWQKSDKKKIISAIVSLLARFIGENEIKTIKIETKSTKSPDGTIYISGLEIKVEL